MFAPVNNQSTLGNAFSWMSSTVQAAPAKVIEVAQGTWTRMVAIPGVVSHGWQVSRTWVIQTWNSFTSLLSRIYTAASNLIHSISQKIHAVLAHHIVQSLIQKIKSALIAAWNFVKGLPTEDKFLYGSLLILGLWSGILPWMLKFTVGCTLSLAAAILPMVIVPLAMVAFCYFAYTHGWFSSLPQVPAAQ